jgi:nucleotidyltransferase/DNA polymerase involved in DNA repair
VEDFELVEGAKNGIDALMDNIYGVFKGHVTAIRGSKLKKPIDDLAGGRVYNRPVVPDREAKSVSHETTFAEDIADREVLRAWLTELAEQVARRLRCHALKGRTVELKVACW